VRLRAGRAGNVEGAEEAQGVVSVVMRDAMGGGAYRGLKNAGVEGQWELGRELV
jgi:hypothetical protein